MALGDNIVAVYHMADASGPLTCEINAANNATPSGGTYAVAGKNGNAFDIDTDGDYISFPKTTGIGSGSFSISFWLKWDKSTGDAIVQRMWMMKSSEIEAYIETSNGLVDFFNSTGFTDTADEILDETWMHIAVTWDGSNSNFYVNGNLSASSPMTDTSDASDIIATWFFGRSSGNVRHLTGVLDEFYIWSRELSGAEVTSLYNSGDGTFYPFAAAGTNIELNIADAWVDVDTIEININDAWVTATGAQVNIADAWVTVF